MSKAPLEIPVIVKGMSDLDKLARRMEVLEAEVTRLNKKLPKTNREVEKVGKVWS